MTDEDRLSVSVVIPTYNASDRLKRTIESVLAQTAPPLEIIVVDDGSTDATGAVCAAFGDAIRYFAVTNGGQQRARNIGAERASGTWVAFLDHDDLWHPEYTAELNEFAASHAFDLALCNSRNQSEEAGARAVTGDRFTEFAPLGYWRGMGADPGGRWSVLERYDYAGYLAFHPAQPSVMTIRKDLFQSLGGFDSRMRGSSAENFEFELRALRVARVGLIWRPLVTIVRHAGNASVDGSKMAMDVIDCLEFAREHHGLTPEETEAVASELQRRLPDAIDGAFTLRRFEAIRGYRKMAGGSTDLKTRIKYAIALLPPAVACLCADILTRGRATGRP